MAENSIPQKKIIVVPLGGWGDIWQIQIIDDKRVRGFNTHSKEQLTPQLVKDAMQHYIDTIYDPKFSNQITPDWIALVEVITEFIDVEDIEIDTDSTRQLYEFGYLK